MAAWKVVYSVERKVAMMAAYSVEMKVEKKVLRTVVKWEKTTADTRVFC